MVMPMSLTKISFPSHSQLDLFVGQGTSGLGEKNRGMVRGVEQKKKKKNQAPPPTNKVKENEAVRTVVREDP